MLCAAEVGAFIWGIIAMVSGKVTLSKDKVVTGFMARVIGLILFMPLPLVFVVGVIYGVKEGMNGREFGQKQQLVATVVELGIFACFAIIAAVLAFTFAKKPRKRWQDDDDEEFRSTRSRYSRRYDDDDDDAPRRRRYEDDDDDRPRRRRAEDDDQPSTRRLRYDEEDEKPRRRGEDDKEDVSRPPPKRSESPAKKEPAPLITPIPDNPGHGIVRCEHCQAQLKIGTAHLGKAVKCPKCQGVFQAPARQEIVGIIAKKTDGRG